MNIKSSLLMAGLAVGVAVPTVSMAAPITPGNLVIYRVGTGSAALSTAHAAVFLDEYTTAGTFVQSIAVSTTGASALSASGSASSEGILSMSQDGTKLCMTGYRKDVGSAVALASNKVIGYVDLTGTVNTATEVSDATSTTVRSATSVDGSKFYMATSGAVRYIGSAGGIATSTVIDARNSRQVQLFNNTLYGSNGSTAITNKLQGYGVLPTALTTPTAVATLATTDAMQGFVMLDMSASVVGYDTAYALSTVENLIRKYTFNGTSWTASGSVSANSAQNIVATQNGSTAGLFMTTTSTLRSMVDASGYGGTLTGTSSVIATAGTNTAFRGVGGFNLVPEPASLVALGLGLALALRKRK